MTDAREPVPQPNPPRHMTAREMPDVYIDGFRGVIVEGGVVMLYGYRHALSYQWEERTLEPTREFCLRLRLPAALLPSLARMLDDLAADPAPPPTAAPAEAAPEMAADIGDVP